MDTYTKTLANLLPQRDGKKFPREALQRAGYCFSSLKLKGRVYSLATHKNALHWVIGMTREYPAFLSRTGEGYSHIARLLPIWERLRAELEQDARATVASDHAGFSGG